MLHNISRIEKSIKSLASCQNPRLYPIIFEYYSAIHMTEKLGKPFFVYEDILAHKKQENNFPVQDKGIDIIDESLKTVGQCKYYSNNSVITYSKLSTFLASDKLVGKPLDYYLIRTEDCKIDTLVRNMINRGDLYDVPINREDFLKYLKMIIKA